MAATVTYKGNTIATVSNQTKTLTTSGKYMEADVVITDTPATKDWVILVSNNLHDSSTDVANYYINHSGVLESYSGWSATDYISVTPNTWYRILSGPGNNWNAFYDSSKNPITNYMAVYIGSEDNERSVSLLKSPPNAYYLRISEATSKVTKVDIREADFNMPIGNVSITSNGTVNVSQYETATINVSGGGSELPIFTITYSSDWTFVSVTCDKTFLEARTSFNNGNSGSILYETNGNESYYSLMPLTSFAPSKLTYSLIDVNSGKGIIDIEYNQNGTINYVNPSPFVPSIGPNLQSKTNISPTTSSQTITADSGYDGLSSVQINAMPTMTLPTAASSTSSGTAKATITPGSTAQYINIPTGYNGTAQYYTISAASGSSGMNVQAYADHDLVNSGSYIDTDVALTVAKSGTYTISWMGWRNTTSGTSGSQLYKNGTAVGTPWTSFYNSYGQHVILTGQSLNQGDELVVRARSRNTSYYMGVGNLIIIQTA